MKIFHFALCLLFMSTGVFAQVPGKPEIDTYYRTYTDAIIDLIDPLSANAGCRGLPSVVGFVPEDGFDELSDRLQELCEPINNGSSGGTLSGGFSEPFSTRTFLPFRVDTVRPAPPAPGDTASEDIEVGQLSFSFLPTGNEPGYFSGVFTGYEYWVTVGVDAVSFEVDDTDFETGRSGNGFRGAFVLGRQLGNGATIGLGLSYEKIETDLNGYSFLFEESTSSQPPITVAAAVASVENFCRNLDRGSEDFETLELNAFYSGNLSRNATFQVFGGVERTKSDLRNPLCFYQITDSGSNDNVFAGYLNGSPEVISASLGARAEGRWRAGNSVLLVRAGAEAKNRWVDGYTQNETSVDASSPPVNGPNPIDVVATGLALTYEDREVFTVTTELGVRGVWEFGGRQNPGALWVDIAYQHVFGDSKEGVTASFAGDGRATPTRFTFRGNPIPEERITLGTGIDYLISDQLISSLHISGSFTDLTETYRVGAALSWRF